MVLRRRTGGWQFYTSDGTQVVSQETEIDGKTYAFDADGYMYSEEFFESASGTHYAFKSGALASGWVMLNEDGTVHSHADDTPECSGIWYYFDKDTMVMAADEEVVTDGITYRVDADGRRLSEAWDDSEQFYYQHDGAKVMGSTRLIDGQWVSFNDSGAAAIETTPHHREVDLVCTAGSIIMTDSNATEEDGSAVATDSNAIEIDDSDTAVEGSIGGTLELEFYVSLASDSNATQQDFDAANYDVWTMQSGVCGVSVGSATSDGVVTVMADVKSTGECRIYLVVDGIVSSNCYVVTGVQASTIDTIVPTDSDAEIDGDHAVEIQKNLAETYAAEDVADVAEHFIENQDVLANVENAYADAMGIKKSIAVSDEAQSLLGEDGEISAIGLALNVTEDHQLVKLEVEKAEESDSTAELGEKYDTVVAFEITMTVNGTNVKELEIPVIITMTLPAGISGTNTQLYHIHDDGVPENITSQVTFENGKAIIVTNKFSTYIFTEGETEIPVVSKEALTTAVKAANAAMEGITVTDKTADQVEKDTKFVSAAAKAELDAAIAKAEAVLNNAEATQDEVDAAVEALNEAVATFNSAIQAGTYVEPEDEDPDDGKTEDPDDGKTEEPDDGKTEDPDDGKTEEPDDGKTEDPDDGKTEEPDDGKTENPITDADKAAIEDAIANANAAMEGISVNNGTAANVADGTKFVSEEEMNALKAAIEAANEALPNAKTTEEANEAIEALNKAIADFNAAIKTGTRTSSGSSESESSGSSGGGSSSSGRKSSSNVSTGQWIQDEIGWWYRNVDGTYPVSVWQQLVYEANSDWYRFDANGYICTGWFTDADGAVYYLNPISDGRKGAMLIGWQFIDGYWYYFNTVSDGHLGALLTNTTTPDGYQVNGLGQWIQ